MSRKVDVLKVEVNPLSSCKTELGIEVEAERWQPDYQAVCQKYLRQARVPGFRPGKAPLPIVQQRFRDSIRADFLDAAVRKYFTEAVESNSLSPLSLPRIADVDFAPGQPFTFKATFEVPPALELPDYKGLEVEQVPTEVKDEEVEAILEQGREQLAEYLPVEDRPARAGDHAVISLEGKYSAAGREDIRDDEVYCELGGKSTPQEFTDNLSGAQSGETRTFAVTYGDDHPDRDLAGQRLSYRVELKAIKQKRLPELDDEFARNAGGYTSLEELRSRVRADCVERKEKAARSEMQSRLVDRLVEDTPFEVPQVLVEEQLQSRLKESMQALMMQGVHPSTLKLDWNQFREQQREKAVLDVKRSILLERIADKEQLTVTDEDLEEEISRIARGADQPIEAVRSRLTKEGGAARIKNTIRNRKCLDLILRLASVKTPPGLIVQP